MTSLSCDVLRALSGRTLVTAESCTGGGIGAVLTAIPGSSSVYKGGVICYSNFVKQNVLGVDPQILVKEGAVSAPVAEQMALGCKKYLLADVCVSVTGLAGPDGDEFGHPVGTVFIGYADHERCIHRSYLFKGDREQIRQQAIEHALKLILEFA